MPIFATLVLFFFLEMFLIVMVAIEGGWGWGVFWVEVATAFLGLMLIRHNRDTTIREIFRKTAQRERIDFNLTTLNSARVLIGGILLILPGFITDGLGFALIVLPKIQSALLGLLRFLFLRRPPSPPVQKNHGRVVEGEVERDNDPKEP